MYFPVHHRTIIAATKVWLRLMRARPGFLRGCPLRHALPLHLGPIRSYRSDTIWNPCSLVSIST